MIYTYCCPHCGRGTEVSRSMHAEEVLPDCEFHGAMKRVYDLPQINMQHGLYAMVEGVRHLDKADLREMRRKDDKAYDRGWTAANEEDADGHPIAGTGGQVVTPHTRRQRDKIFSDPNELAKMHTERFQYAPLDG